MDQILKSHMIDPSLLHSDDFNSFFIAREAVLLSLIEKAMGKPIARIAGKEELDTIEDESTVEDQS